MASADVGARQQRTDARDLLDFDRRGVRSGRLSDSSGHRIEDGCYAGLPRSLARSPAYSPLPLIRSARLRRFAILHDHQAEPMLRLSFFNLGRRRSTGAPREGPAPRVRPRRKRIAFGACRTTLIPDPSPNGRRGAFLTGAAKAGSADAVQKASGRTPV